MHRHMHPVSELAAVAVVQLQFGGQSQPFINTCMPPASSGLQLFHAQIWTSCDSTASSDSLAFMRMVDKTGRRPGAWVSP